MKLLLTIVQDADAGRLQQGLSSEGFQSTKLASTGGFLREGNTTFIIGIEEKDVPRVMEIIHETCRERNRIVAGSAFRSEEHTSELQSRGHLVCRLLLEKKKNSHKTPAQATSRKTK